MRRGLQLIFEQAQHSMGRTGNGTARQETQETGMSRKPEEGESQPKGMISQGHAAEGSQVGDSAAQRPLYLTEAQGDRVTAFIYIYQYFLFML